ncbi:MAG: hypothetical protein QM755_16020 [Luteolibacter sp.]
MHSFSLQHRAAFAIAVTFVGVTSFLLWPRDSDPASASVRSSRPEKPASLAESRSGEPVALPPKPRPAGPARRQDLVWQEEVPEPVFAAFRDWTTRYEAASSDKKKAMIGEGIQLAQSRRTSFADLMRMDPARALELAVPVTVRRGLPGPVLALLETPVDNRGDIEHYAGLADEGGVIPPDSYEVRVEGESLKAYVTAERAEQPSRYGVPVHGYQLDGGIVVRPTAGRTARTGGSGGRACGRRRCDLSGFAGGYSKPG